LSTPALNPTGARESMFAFESATIEEIQGRLRDWYSRVRRPLPWRSPRTLYGTWISEIMLQQTTVAAVVPYWERFMASFPDVQALAAASEQEVLALWTGLGYYRRARHLHQAARSIAAAGAFPATRREWARLPGVGPYTSGAIASLVLGEPVPAVDANARRVLTRLLVGDPDHLVHLSDRILEQEAGRMVSSSDPGSWNEGLMELGALVCTARRAGCRDCPLLIACRSGLAGTAGEIPAPRERRASEPVVTGMLVLRHRGKVLLTPPGTGAQLAFTGRPRTVRGDFASLHGGLWGLPATAWVESESVGESPSVKAVEPLARWLGQGRRTGQPGPLAGLKPRGVFKHAITRYRLDVIVFVADFSTIMDPVAGVKDIDLSGPTDYAPGKEIFNSGLHPDDPPAFFCSPHDLPLSGLARKALELDADNFG
jgi:A/G-specific adenine glycosylase